MPTVPRPARKPHWLSGSRHCSKWNIRRLSITHSNIFLDMVRGRDSSVVITNMDRRHGTWQSVITIDWRHLTWAACADSRMSNGITMYETSLSDNKTAPRLNHLDAASIALVRSPAAYATRKWSPETAQLLLAHNRPDATKGPSTTTVVGLRNSRPRSHRPPPRRGSSYRPASHRLVCHSSSCDLYGGWPARALSQVSQVSQSWRFPLFCRWMMDAYLSCGDITPSSHIRQKRPVILCRSASPPCL